MTLEGRVRQKLESRPELRADDKKLIVAVWEDLGLHLTPEQQKKLFAVYAPESIRRVRQKLNERGIGLPDVRTQKKRKVLAEPLETRRVWIQSVVTLALPNRVWGSTLMRRRSRADNAVAPFPPTVPTLGGPTPLGCPGGSP